MVFPADSCDLPSAQAAFWTGWRRKGRQAVCDGSWAVTWQHFLWNAGTRSVSTYLYTLKSAALQFRVWLFLPGLLACKRERVFSSNEAVEKCCSLCSSHPQAGFVETTSKRTAVAIVCVWEGRRAPLSAAWWCHGALYDQPLQLLWNSPLLQHLLLCKIENLHDFLLRAPVLRDGLL